MGRTSVNKPMALPARAARFLDELLAAIAAGGLHGHQRRSDRIALTVRPCTRRRDHLPGGLIEFDAWRLICLSHRWCAGGPRGVRRRLPLAIYRPAIDLPGTGRIHFACERAYDAASRGTGYAPSAFENPSAARAAVLLHQAAEDAAAVDLATTLAIVPEFYFGFLPGRPPVFEPTWPEEAWGAHRVEVGGLSLWPSWLFARPAGGRWDVHPLDGSAPPAADRAAAEGDLSEGGGWVLAGGAWTPLCQEPAAVLADFAGMATRTVRNPAWAVLRAHGLIPRAESHRRWLDTLRARRPAPPVPAALTGSPVEGPAEAPAVGGTDAHVPLPVPDPEPVWPSPRDALRGAIEAYALGEEVDGAYPRQAAMLKDLRSACEALGVPIPEGRANAEDFFTGLLMAPWEPVAVPQAAALQVVKLTGAPDPATMVFRADHLEVDLYDLGKEAPYYDRVPSRLVDEVLRQRPGRGTRPWQKLTAP